MKFAIIQTGGKQYRVEEGTMLKVEKLDSAVGKAVIFDRVLLMYEEGKGAQIGAPYLEGVKVNGTVVEQGKSPKTIIFKYKAKKRYRKKSGHRQPFTMVRITQVGGEKSKKRTATGKKTPKPLKARSKKRTTRSKPKPLST